MLKLQKVHWSTLLVTGFAGFLFLVGFFAEAFQTPPLSNEMSELVKNPIPVHRLKRLRGLSFTNKSGTFKFENSHSNSLLEGPWQLIEPTNAKARKDFFVKVLQELTDLQVRHTHSADPINLQSFSLDNPLFEIKLEPIQGEMIELAFGLINPIDNSTYFLIRGQEWIYQVTAFNIPLESVTLDDLLDSKALALNPNSIYAIELYTTRTRGFAYQLFKKNGNWQDSQGKTFDEKKVNSFLNSLLNLKSYLVLDKLSENQALELTQLMVTPEFELRIQTLDSLEIFYVSAPFSQLADLRLERSQSVLFYKKGSSHPLVLAPDQLAILNKNAKEFR